MKPLYRNIFLLIGVAAVVIMLLNFDMSWDEVWQRVQSAGLWFPAVVGLWLPIYVMNVWAWYVIIHDGESQGRIGFFRLLKYTISGYALNYVTPVGVLGGEPYRIMELTPYVGTAKATSSVILYAMMHIFSHFCFWAASVVLFLILYFDHMNVALWLLIGFVTVFCAFGIFFFAKGYRDGLALKALRWAGKLPWVGKSIRAFTAENEASICRVDDQIAALHAQRKSTFYLSLSLEFLARVVSCLELMFCMLIITDHISFWDCILMQAFTSLFANLIFIIPMQMGVREGGMALFTDGLKMSGGYGVLTSLLVRLREIIWIIIGMSLLKVGNKKFKNTQE